MFHRANGDLEPLDHLAPASSNRTTVSTRRSQRNAASEHAGVVPTTTFGVIARGVLLFADRRVRAEKARKKSADREGLARTPAADPAVVPGYVVDSSTINMPDGYLELPAAAKTTTCRILVFRRSGVGRIISTASMSASFEMRGRAQRGFHGHPRLSLLSRGLLRPAFSPRTSRREVEAVTSNRLQFDAKRNRT